MQQRQDTLIAGYCGRSKTLEYHSRTYTWPKMQADIDHYTWNCHTCQCSKSNQHALFGVLRPLPIPECPWQDISMDFITRLPWSNGYDTISVVVDQLTKERHLIPYCTNIYAKELANLFIAYIFHCHGLPLMIISDRGPQFSTLFWRYHCHCLGIDPQLSMAFYPQTNSQTE
jgi:transposase InsO family protein